MSLRDWQNWPVEKQARWVFWMTMLTMAAGLVIGLVLGVVIR